MAYGLDFQEIYYTDHNRWDLGVLETYEIDIDLANEKDFQIESPEPVIPIGGFWYIQDTEYGGIVDSFETDSDEEKITYVGRTFRGILNSHYVDVEGKERVIPTEYEAELDEHGAIEDAGLQATITDCLNELVTDFGGLFVVDEPYVYESIDTRVSDYRVKAGTTVYDAMVGLARSIDFTFTLEYRADHRVHITPIVIQDYVDYLKGSKHDGLGFKTEITTDVINHIIATSEDEETGELYRIHFFTDENGGLQPYATVDNPYKDDHYILDKSSQSLFGIDEIASYEESSVSVTETYELLADVPSDWAMNFGTYFKREVDEEGQESFNEYEAVGDPIYTQLTSKPSDWNSNYSSYYIWRDEEYTPVSAESTYDYSNPRTIDKKPFDWSSNYSEYFYLRQTGTGREYVNYEGVQHNKMVKLTSKPYDWDTNFGSYYRKIFKKEIGTEGKKKGKPLVDTVKYNGVHYVACKADDDGKGKRKPKFSRVTHYRNDTYEVPPTFMANNCYRLNRIETVPTWDSYANRYFSMKMVYHAPPFIKGEGYQKVYDHYASMLENARDIFEDEQKKSTQTMELEDFVVNVGDIVGGTDEFTGTSVIGSITNIEAKIESGLIDVSYSVTVDDYTTKINVNRLPEDEEEE